jgi:hypothetical protein
MTVVRCGAMLTGAGDLLLPPRMTGKQCRLVRSTEILRHARTCAALTSTPTRDTCFALLHTHGVRWRNRRRGGAHGERAIGVFT